jgi:hypothetical protein
MNTRWLANALHVILKESCFWEIYTHLQLYLEGDVRFAVEIEWRSISHLCSFLSVAKVRGSTELRIMSAQGDHQNRYGTITSDFAEAALSFKHAWAKRDSQGGRGHYCVWPGPHSRIASDYKLIDAHTLSAAFTEVFRRAQGAGSVGLRAAGFKHDKIRYHV